MLNSRSLKNLLRNKLLFAARIGQVRPRFWATRSFYDQLMLAAGARLGGAQTVFLGLIIIGVYGEMDSSQESIQSRQGVLFFLTVNQMMLSTMVCL
jgi:hypothetical protein